MTPEINLIGIVVTAFVVGAVITSAIVLAFKKRRKCG
jgi:hypothetical protein